MGNPDPVVHRDTPRSTSTGRSDPPSRGSLDLGGDSLHGSRPLHFFYRGLYQLCPDDDVTAFVIAHEMAHHDLGHMSLVPEWMGRMGRRWGGQMAVIAAAAAAKRLYGPERECDADIYALQLCVKAGYDPERCLKLFQVLENYFLDHGDISAVVGVDEESDQELEPSASRMTKLRVWLISGGGGICRFGIGYLPFGGVLG